MKVLFENQTIYTRKLYLEAQTKWYRMHGRTTRYFSVAIGAFCLASAFYYGSRQAYAAAGVFVAVCLLMIFMFFKGNYFQAVRAYDKQKELFPEVGFQWVITSNCMLRKAADFEKKYMYKQVSKIYETRNTICMVIEGQIHILDKRGFTHGSSQGFIEWIAKKNPRALKRSSKPF